LERQLFLAQRITAMILAPWVLVHLALIFYAMRNGLTAGEILSRTQGSIIWASFYGIFVVTCAIHAPIGIRAILKEWLSMKTGWANLTSLFLAALLLISGLRAVWAVVG